MLRLSCFVTPAPLAVARERGLIDGIAFEEITATGSPAQLAGLLSGQIDLAVTAIDNLFGWLPAGADVRLVGQVEQTTALAVHAAPGSRSLADLQGRRFAVDAYANGFALIARHMLRTAGVDVEWVEVGGVGERLEALTAGDVDATLLGPPFDARAVEAGFAPIARVQHAFPAFPGQGLVVRAALVGTPELDRLLTGLREAGLQPVDPEGLSVLTGIRADLAELPAGVDLSALVHPRPDPAAR